MRANKPHQEEYLLAPMTQIGHLRKHAGVNQGSCPSARVAPPGLVGIETLSELDAVVGRGVSW